MDGRRSGNDALIRGNGGMRSENGGVIGWNGETGGGIGRSKMEGWRDGAVSRPPPCSGEPAYVLRTERIASSINDTGEWR